MILDLIRTRIAKTSFHLLNTLNLLLKHATYTATSGPTCYIPNGNEENDNEKQDNVFRKTKQYAPNREFPSLIPVLTDLASSDFLRKN